MNKPQFKPNRMGSVMYILAWICGLLLLSLAFNDWLTDKQNPNERARSHTTANGVNELILKPNQQHQYVLNGTINHKKVLFLLDTGATQVAIPGAIAAKLGLKKGLKGFAHTANGRANVYYTHIQHLSLGGIQLHDIQATIIPNMQGPVILLGMNALKYLDISTQNGELILRQ